MAVAVADKEAEMTEWNDGRLDDLSKRVDRVEKKMDAGFDAVNKRLDGIQRSLVQIAWTFGVGMLTLASALVGLVATKL